MLLRSAALAVAVFVIAVLSNGYPETGSRAFAQGEKQGDVNCDAAVNSVDALQILRSVAGLGTPAACLAEAGDVNCDDAVNSVDSLRILRYVAGLSSITPDGCVPIGEETEIAANSYQLIQAALDAGDLDPETALTYKIFATFSDPRLPALYQGDDDAVSDDPGALTEALVTFDTLSTETQELLAPFLLWPAAEGSWQQLRAEGTLPSSILSTAAPISYSGIDTSTHVKVWYRQDRPQDQATAQALANEVDTKIWGSLTGLMGEPLEDTARVPNGGDGRIDVLLAGDAIRSYAQPVTCKATSASIVLGTGGANAFTLTHELMHVVTFHFNVQSACEFPEYRWINEATSQWAIDFVYPSSQKERGDGSYVTKCFLDHPGLPLEYRNDCHEYGAYVFLFHLARNYGDQKVRDIWNAFAASNSLAGVQAATAGLGGWKDTWNTFVLQDYNRDPQDQYKDFDGLTIGAKLQAKENISLGGGPSQTYDLPGDVEHLAAFYHRYTFTDSDIKKVVFKHSLAGEGTASVQALIKYEEDEDWVVEDWTPEPFQKWCYDDPGQKKFEEVVIIISNNEAQNRTHVLDSNPQPQLEVRDTCECGDPAAPIGWTGHVTFDYHGHAQKVDGDAVTTVDVNRTASLDFEMDEWYEEPSVKAWSGNATGSASINDSFTYHDPDIDQSGSTTGGPRYHFPSITDGQITLDRQACTFRLNLQVFITATRSGYEFASSVFDAWISDIPADSVAFSATQQVRAYDNITPDPPWVRLASDSVEFISQSHLLAQILGEDNLGTATVAYNFQPIYDEEP